MSFKIIFTILFLSLAFWLTNNHKYKFYIIQSGSMEPSFQIGDLVIIQLQTKYQNNDVITFKTKDNKIVTHRIINIVDKNNYFTKGWLTYESHELTIQKIKHHSRPGEKPGKKNRKDIRVKRGDFRIISRK